MTQSILGIVYPKLTQSIALPINATVTQCYVKQGDQVDAGQALFEAYSVSLNFDIRRRIAAYLQAKQEYLVQKNEADNVRHYTELDIQPKKTYQLQSEKVERSLANFIDKEDALRCFVADADLFARIEAVNPADQQQVIAILQDKKIGHLNVSAPKSGIVILPESQGQIAVGQPIHAHTPILHLGDSEDSFVVVYVKAEQLSLLQDSNWQILQCEAQGDYLKLILQSSEYAEYAQAIAAYPAVVSINF